MILAAALLLIVALSDLSGAADPAVALPAVGPSGQQTRPIDSRVGRTELASFDDCDERVAKEHTSQAYDCYLTLVRRGSDWHTGAARLQAILDRDPGDLDATFTLANILGEQGEVRAEALYRRAATAFADRGRTDRAVLAHRNLANLLNNQGRLEEAQTELDAAAGLAEKSRDPILVAVVRNQQAAQLVLANRDLGRAYRMLKEVEAAIFPDGPEQTRSGCLYYLAIAAFEMGRMDEAAGYFERMADLDRRRGNAWSEANAYLGLLRVDEEGMARQDHWSREEVEPMVRRGLDAALRAGNRYAEAIFRGRLAQLLDTEEARSEAEQALALSRELRWSDGVSSSLIRLAEVEAHGSPADPTTAFALVDEAIEHDRQRGKKWKMAQALFVRADLRWEVGPRNLAIRESLAALDAFEAVRDLQSDEDARTRVFSMSIVHYYSLIGRLLSGDGGSPSRQDLELAFAVSERRRARALLETLDAAHVTTALASRSQSWHERESVLRRIADVQRRLLDEGLDDAERLDSLAQLEQLERRERALRAAMAEENDRFADLRAPRFATLADAESALAEDTALLVYQLGSERRSDGGYGGGSWLMVVTSDGTAAYSLGDARRLEPAIDLFLGLLQSPEGQWQRATSHLYEALLGPAVDALPPRIRRLVVIPDGLLHRFPLAVLHPSTTADPLLERFETSVVPSFSTWLRLHRRPRPKTAAAVLVLADPARPPGANDDDATLRGNALWTAPRLAALPAARSEGRTAVRRLGGGSRMLAGEAASEAALKSDLLHRYAIVHLAAHAIVNEKDPARSAIVLAPGSPSEDGLLQMREIVDLPLDGKTVVLSACRSASGELDLGEGILGLSRAFFQAGARAVVASLWPLRDEDARRLMADLYRELAQGQTLAASLATAQRRRRLESAPPSAWAGIELLGDGEVRFVDRNVSPPRWRKAAPTFLLLPILLALLLWAATARQRGARPFRRK